MTTTMTDSSEFKLRERIKELNCLYKLSHVAWEAKNDVNVIIARENSDTGSASAAAAGLRALVGADSGTGVMVWALMGAPPAGR